MASFRALLWRGALPALAALLALPSAAGTVGIPGTFPRAIVIVGSNQGVSVSRFEVSARATGRKVRVTVRVAATGVGHARHLVLAVGPSTAGPPSSPLCKPAATARLTVPTTGVDVTRSFVVPQPARNPDALRVTLTGGGQPIPYERNHVGGGGGTAETLLNGGTWRYRQGTRWGFVASPPAGVVLGGVKFNSRTYAWKATSTSDATAVTRIGYEGAAPRFTFTTALPAGATRSLRHTPSRPGVDPRPAPRTLLYTADVGAQRMLTVRIPLPAWRGTLARAAATESCTRVYQYRAVETPLKVTPDLTVRLRNPYGRLVNIGRYFVQFAIRYASAADRAKVSAVQWALDGASVKHNRGGRDAYLFGSFHLTPGPHVITATITPASGGAAVTGTFRFTATPCAPMSFAATSDNRKAPGAQPMAFDVYGGSTALRRVELGSKSALVSTAARLRGRKVGELRYVTGTREHVEDLRLPRQWHDPHAIALVRRGSLRVVLDPTARRFLTVTGLPDAVTNLHLSFGGPKPVGQLPVEGYNGAPAGTAGLIGTRGRCRGAIWDAWVSGPAGRAVHATSTQSPRAFRACQS
jgi:hypothetical protein